MARQALYWFIWHSFQQLQFSRVDGLGFAFVAPLE
jgi:hypothetical protein